MTISADFHLFGSITGYETQALSIGVTTEEEAELKRFNFFNDAISGDQIRKIGETIIAFLHPLPTGRFAIRCLTSDPKPDVHNRPTILACSLILTNQNYLKIAMRRTDDGNGLEALLQDAKLWADIAKASGRELLPLQLPVPPARSKSREYRYEDLQIYDAWVQVQENKSTALIPPIPSFESRLLVLPALMSTKNAENYLWGIRIFNPIQPGVVASFYSEEFIPRTKNLLRIQIDGPITSRLGLQSQELTSHFPPEMLCKISATDLYMKKIFAKHQTEIEDEKSIIKGHKDEIAEHEVKIEKLIKDYEVEIKKLNKKIKNYLVIFLIVFVITLFSSSVYLYLYL